jgi:poly-gamma-glutamate synthase PgsB/CapB
MTATFILTFMLLAVLLARLRAESARLRLARSGVRLRVAVTGIRGKSSVTRLIAAGLRASGLRVLAKTTGSRPVLILPDGSESEIVRQGPASLREQARLLSRAAALGADALVVETMSIRPEYLGVEVRGVIQPGLVAVTNVHLDHMEEMGRTKEEIAASLASALPEGALVVFPEEELPAAFAAAVLARRARPVRVAADDAFSLTPAGGLRSEFAANVRLAAAVLREVGVSEEDAARGMRQAEPDFGSLRAWLVPLAGPAGRALCVSAFAANDPESSAAALSRVRPASGSPPGPLIGLVCLRDDRPERTGQWLEAAAEGFFEDFARVAFIGRPARAARMKMAKLRPSFAGEFVFETSPAPAALMDRLSSGLSGRPVFIGLANIIGLGESFIAHWEKAGVVHDL